MKTLTTYTPMSRAGTASSTATVLGPVVGLVAATIGIAAAGAFIGRDLSSLAALAATFVAFGMLIAQAFGGERFRVGAFAVCWLFAIGLVLGLGLGPVLALYASVDPAALESAVLATALVVAATGAGGYALGRDLAGWQRPLSIAIFGIVVLSLVLFLAGSGGNPLISVAIAIVSALLILVDFNYVRRHGTSDDVVVLATGIFVSVVNVLLSLLNLFSSS